MDRNEQKERKKKEIIINTSSAEINCKSNNTAFNRYAAYYISKESSIALVMLRFTSICAVDYAKCQKRGYQAKIMHFSIP